MTGKLDSGREQNQFLVHLSPYSIALRMHSEFRRKDIWR